jgi:RNA polymerase sigma factor (sigma-70 family)
MKRRGERILALADRVHTVAKLVAGPRLGYVDLHDLEQDGWVGLLEAATRYDGSTRFRTFVDLRLRGAMIDGLRRQNPRHRDTGEPYVQWERLPETAAESWPSKEPSPETHYYARQLWALVDQLPPRQAHVMRRLFQDGERQRELARELRIGRSGIDYLRREALDTLRAQLTGDPR